MEVEHARTGYIGKVAKVDLTSGSCKAEPLNTHWARLFIGGKGLGARYLYELLPPSVDALSPRNVIIFMTGPLTGTIASTMSRMALITKSPATNTFLDSYAGGYFPAELKYAGFDSLIVTGRADKPSYIYINDGRIDIRDASHIWGLNTHETVDALTTELGEKFARVGTIGPAGERLVKFACVAFEKRHYAGRGGAGAVMGSKNLKAVVAKGSLGPKALPINGNREFANLVRELIRDEIRNNPGEEWALKYGTPFVVALSNEVGILPTRNFRSGVFENVSGINMDALKDRILDKHYSSCFSCSIGCRNDSSVKDGEYAGVHGEGPEYETIALGGSNCGIGRIEAVLKFSDTVSKLGMDTISTGNVIAFAMELFERGILSSDELGGLDLGFGNEGALLKLAELIAYRRGVGDILAEGVQKAADRIGRGSERYALHVKGLEYPGYDPRGSVGMALGYATSDRGACHGRAWTVAYEAFGKLDPFTTDGKAQLVMDDQVQKAVRWSLTACEFYPVNYSTMIKLLAAATGYSYTEEELSKIGRRIWNLTRLFNVREGFTRKDDTMPARIAEDPLPAGRTEGKVVKYEDFYMMLNQYYALQGWDEEGRPKKETLMELGLQDLVLPA